MREVVLHARLRNESLIVDVVVAFRADTRRDPVETEARTCAPRDVVIGARGVTAHANRADELLARVVEWQPASEHVHAADALAYQRIVRLTELTRRAGVRGARVDRIAVLQAIQRAARLHSSPEIRRRER